VRNSNPGATVFQDLRLANGTRVFQVVAAALEPLEARLTSPGAAWSSLAVTVAATRPDDSELIRGLLPRSLFLVLGYGAQGGSAQDAVRGFVRGPAGREGGIVNASRSVLFPDDAREADAVGWARSIGRALDRAIDPLRKASES
jgi:orotidine-5'-phosphate decarboxylase